VVKGCAVFRLAEERMMRGGDHRLRPLSFAGCLSFTAIPSGVETADICHP